MRKKGQVSAAPGAANLILILLLLLALYILFIPPGERQEILEGEDGGNGNGNGNGHVDPSDPSVILLEQPGRLSFMENKEFEHSISSFYLYKETEAVELKDINTIYVTHSSFEERSRNVTLDIENLDSLENVMLSFQAETSSGILTIALNGEIIYENEIREEVVDPIRLPRGTLEEENLLQFYVADPEWRFWKKNEYRLTDVKVVADYTDLSKQQATNTFFVSADESANLKSATLSFIPKCDEEAPPGNLYVRVNANNIYSKAPDCGVSNSIQFDPNMLAEGSNSVVFQADEGDYLIEQIKIRTQLKEDASIVYHFDINESKMRRIRVGAEHVDLELEFVSEGEPKEGELVINGHRSGFYTTDLELEKRIDAYVQEGGNAIRLVPKTTMDITNLIIRYD